MAGMAATNLSFIHYLVSPTPYTYGTIGYLVSPTPYTYGTIGYLVSSTPYTYGTIRYLVSSTPYTYGTIGYLVSPSPLHVRYHKVLGEPLPPTRTVYHRHPAHTSLL